MNTNIFVPTKINVGYQNRSDTYTGKLAYVIYYDKQGKLRKEKSWQNWRDQNIPNEEFENTPTEGFVLNKKVGGSGHYNRHTYTRIYDPRGFEFEITIPNLLWILENCDCMKGKGLVGEFIYGWDGKELVLIPVDSPDYKEITEKNKIIHNDRFIKAKDLIIGATYETLTGYQYVYMGKSNYYDYKSITCKYPDEVPLGETWFEDKMNAIPLSLSNKTLIDSCKTFYKPVNKGKYFWFIKLKKPDSYFYWEREEVYVEAFRTINRKFFKTISTECHSEYVDFVNLLKRDCSYSAIDYEHIDAKCLSINDFIKYIKTGTMSYQNGCKCQTIRDDKLYEVNIYHDEISGKFYYILYNYKFYCDGVTTHSGHDNVLFNNVVFDNLIDLYHDIQPMYMVQYLKNGEIYKRSIDYGNEKR